MQLTPIFDGMTRFFLLFVCQMFLTKWLTFCAMKPPLMLTQSQMKCRWSHGRHCQLLVMLKWFVKEVFSSITLLLLLVK